MNVRIGTVQRNDALEKLGRALEEGYLDLPEYEQRMTRVTAAKTADELVGPLSDLPPQLQWNPQQLQGIPQQSFAAGQPYPTDNRARATSIASLVLAVLSVPLALCYGVGGLFGIAAVILSIPGLRSTTHHGKALAGFVVGIVGTLFSIAMFLLLVFVAN